MLRNCVVGLWLIAALAIGGCGALDSFFLPNPATPNEPSVSEKASDFANHIPGGWGGIAGALLLLMRHGYVEVRHYQLVKAGKKDDNKNGVDDALEGQQQPPVNPA